MFFPAGAWEPLNPVIDKSLKVFDLHGGPEKYYKLSEEGDNMRQQKARNKFAYVTVDQPELVDRVKDKYLASYLGVTPGTFSLEKRQFAKSNKKI